MMNTIYSTNYEQGIVASKNFIDEARIKGIKLVHNVTRCFWHNVELWYIWFWKIGVTNIIVTTNMLDVKEDDLCVIISHLFNNCPSKKYVALQTEDLIQKKHLNTDIIQKAYVTWDYSAHNIEFLIKNYGIKNIVCVPITISDNTKLFQNILFNHSFSQKNFDVIVPIHGKRRVIIKRKLSRMGLKCVTAWRNALPTYINKSKIFLNVHRDSDTAVLEIHRLFDARNAPIVVISEDSLDKDFQNKLDKIPFVKYNDICKLCHQIATDANLWEKYVLEQQEMWKKFSCDNINSSLEMSIYGEKIS